MKNINGITTFFILTVLIVINIVVSMSVFGDSDSERQEKIKININDSHTINFDKTLNPFLYNGRVFVPVNILSNDLHYSVEWNNTFDKAILSNGDKEIQITSGTNIIKVNGEERILEKNNKNIFPMLKYERVFIPIRFIVEEFSGIVKHTYKEDGEHSTLIVDINTEHVERDRDKKKEVDKNGEHMGILYRIRSFIISLWDSFLSLFN